MIPLFQRGLTEETFIVPQVLDLLLQAGFEQTRYFKIAETVPDQRILMVLAYSAPNDTSSVGYRLSYENSTLNLTGFSNLPVISSAESYNARRRSDQPNPVDDLDLHDKSWVVIPVLKGGLGPQSLIGEIVCIWDGPETDLSEDDRVTLGLLGTLLACTLGPAAPKGGGVFRRIEQLFNENSNENEILSPLIREIASSVNLAIIALFRYDWARHELVKIREYLDPKFDTATPEFPETYSVGRNRHLTGQAWDDQEYRFIFDYDLLRRNQQQLVYEPSYQRHSDVLGGVTSTLYGVLGKSEQKYLMRCFNRSDIPQVMIDPSQREFFDTLCQFATNLLDIKIIENRLIAQRRLSDRIMSRSGGLNEVMTWIGEALRQEHVDSFAVCCHQGDNRGWTFEHGFGPEFEGWTRNRDGEWAADQFYARAINNFQPEVMTLRISENLDEHTLEGHLGKLNISRALVFPFRGPNPKGIMVFPMRQGEETPPRSTGALDNRIPKTLDVLRAYSAIAE